MTGRTSRAERLTMPLARDAIRVLAEARDGCIRPVQLRRTNIDTGQVDQQIIPCGSTLEVTCPACAKRARNLRAEQCSDGWHLEDEPSPGQPEPDETQEYWLTLRAEARRDRGPGPCWCPSYVARDRLPAREGSRALSTRTP